VKEVGRWDKALANWVTLVPFVKNVISMISEEEENILKPKTIIVLYVQT